MLLCLDVGNTHIFGGVFHNDQLRLKYRYDSKQGGTSDQIGVFLKQVLRENNLSTDTIRSICICSVVPNIDYTLRAACKKYFSISPLLLKAGIKTGLQIKYRNPLEVGADRIANAIAAVNLFPQENILVVDFGTATTITAISKDKHYLGGSIMPGVRLSMDALQINTAKLMPVEIIKPKEALGRSTIESIQAGLYFGQLAAISDIAQRISASHFGQAKPRIIATGGFCHLFEGETIFNEILPDLVLTGLYHTYQLNHQPQDA